MNTAITFSNESPKVFFKDGRLVTTSQAVADYFDKQHKHVLAKIYISQLFGRCSDCRNWQRRRT